MTTKQVKAFLQIGRGAVTTLLRKGKLHPLRVGNRLLFVAEEVRSLLTANVVVAKQIDSKIRIEELELHARLLAESLNQFAKHLHDMEDRKLYGGYNEIEHKLKEVIRKANTNKNQIMEKSSVVGT